MLAQVKGDGLRAVRDRALQAPGMAAALRWAELAALTVGSVGALERGLELRLGATKSDQSGEGATIAIPEGSRSAPRRCCSIQSRQCAALRRGSSVRPPRKRRYRCFGGGPGTGLTAAPMFDKAVARLVKHCTGAAGYDAARFSGHSRRAGFLAEAASQGATIFKMQQVSRHKTVQILSD